MDPLLHMRTAILVNVYWVCPRTLNRKDVQKFLVNSLSLDGMNRERERERERQDTCPNIERQYKWHWNYLYGMVLVWYGMVTVMNRSIVVINFHEMFHRWKQKLTENIKDSSLYHSHICLLLLTSSPPQVTLTYNLQRYQQNKTRMSGKHLLEIS